MDGAAFAIVELAMREAALFAAVGFLLLGAGDVAVDLIWLGARRRRSRRATLDRLPRAKTSGRLAVFVPAWDEGAVVGAMLRATLSAWGPGGYLVYVGCYRNDPATIAAVSAVDDPRIRLVIGRAPGPTTKACSGPKIQAKN